MPDAKQNAHNPSDSDQTLVDQNVAARWNQAFVEGTDKNYPNLDLVRLELWHFEHKPGHLLEYAFGSGVNTIHLANCGHQVKAVDVSNAAAKLVQGKLDSHTELRDQVDLHVLDWNAQKLPFPDNYFDYVVAVSIMSLLATPKRINLALAELNRTLKVGGKIITDVNSNQSQFAVDGVMVDKNVYENRGRQGTDDPVRCFCPDNPDTFAKILQKHFHVDDIGYAAHQYYNNQIHEYIYCATKRSD